MTIDFSSLTRSALPALFVLVLFATSSAFAQNAPTVIRFGSAEPGTGAKPFSCGNPLPGAKDRGWLEDEFAKNNIKVCPRATDRCRSEAPARRPVGGNHVVACHLV